jgi:hypothetical protein
LAAEGIVLSLDSKYLSSRGGAANEVYRSARDVKGFRDDRQDLVGGRSVDRSSPDSNDERAVVVATDEGCASTGVDVNMALHQDCGGRGCVANRGMLTSISEPNGQHAPPSMR